MAQRPVYNRKTGNYDWEYYIPDLGFKVGLSIFTVLLLGAILYAGVAQGSYFTKCHNQGGQMIETGSGYKCFSKGTLKELVLD